MVKFWCKLSLVRLEEKLSVMMSNSKNILAFERPLKFIIINVCDSKLAENENPFP